MFVVSKRRLKRFLKKRKMVPDKIYVKILVMDYADRSTEETSLDTVRDSIENTFHDMIRDNIQQYFPVDLLTDDQNEATLLLRVSWDALELILTQKIEISCGFDFYDLVTTGGNYSYYDKPLIRDSINYEVRRSEEVMNNFTFAVMEVMKKPEFCNYMRKLQSNLKYEGLELVRSNTNS